MGFYTPQVEDSPTYPGQAILDACDLSAVASATNDTGVVSGFGITATGSTMVLTLASGVGSYLGAPIVNSGGTVTPSNGGTYDRRDAITLTSAGALAVVAGTPCTTANWTAASVGNPPVKPAIPSTSILLYEVYVPAGATSLSSGNIIDKRVALTTGLVFNVQNYGAIANGNNGGGGTDCTTAVQAAITEINSVLSNYPYVSAILYFPPGQYLLGGALTGVPYGLTVRGAGTNATTIWIPSSSTNTTFNLGTFNSGINLSGMWQGTNGEVTFENFSAIVVGSGNYTLEGSRTATFIQDNNNGGLRLNNIFVEGFKFGFAAPYGGQYEQFNNASFQFCDYGIYLGPGAEQIWLANTSTYGCLWGLYLENSTQGVATQCTFADSGNADICYAGSTGTTTIFGITAGLFSDDVAWAINDCWFETSDAGTNRIPVQNVLTRAASVNYPGGISINRPFIAGGGNPNFTANTSGTPTTTNVPYTSGSGVTPVHMQIVLGGVAQFNASQPCIITAQSGGNLTISPALPSAPGSGVAITVTYNPNNVFWRISSGSHLWLNNPRNAGNAMQAWVDCNPQYVPGFNSPGSNYPVICLTNPITTDGYTAAPPWLASSGHQFGGSVYFDTGLGPSGTGIGGWMGSSTGVLPLKTSVIGDTYNRFALGSDGAQNWGSGSATADTTLSRSAAGVLTVGNAIKPSGLTGATAASRYVGATTAGAPTSGTFVVGDFVIDESGSVWVCTSAGTPGTWAPITQPADYYLGPAGGISGFCVGETFPRRTSEGQSMTLVSGSLYMGALYLPGGETIGSLGTVTAGTAAISPTHQWMALFNSSRVMLAVTADQTSTALGTYAEWQHAIATIASGSSSTFTTTYSGLYYLGFMMTAGTMPTLFGKGGPGLGIAPIAGGISNTGQSTPPSFAFTASAIGTTNYIPYGWVS